ncbi:putative membrane protein YeaQ/YmgE (transglycosylase-associated protein family) [Bradyrhizobium japonicum]|uniref:GlsB/YeaQ/YmgE family stress response membrane protein n=1 Tax=Bradyrhizobium barranii subsp. barranii TaxID=2823807 RepID=A0A7Z0TS14_9BRAD|nr:GlsB/YeaQ/YmgE family stress response membrane protein [Bradyrhizobium liaoningense]MCP1747142.1 putative membrane protein YeaQ/YmgE (transglycosylase-associated protein family) [Bradyrhizobium japonicum]MBR1002422.1 GlsB/YeaQ/YmgE family stress response membrane protein [Bradyrhizobium liaoningense]MCP1865600.1 putative membrane protein YeaQ/YmgE (transglycosylase-associated protein family) [Bradyrhizobium japonicum]MCP1895629.1 putative membrane protein YeaQ/YmgE (transglycosylase-associat
MGIIWTIIIGFIARVIAKFIMPGGNEPTGFVLTTILGIVGAFVATYLGQGLGWYRPGEGAGLVGAVIGAIIVLFVYGLMAGRSGRAMRTIRIGAEQADGNFRVGSE